jgi:hypothetical protein
LGYHYWSRRSVAWKNHGWYCLLFFIFLF